MFKFSRLPLSLLAMTIAAPVLAAEPAATMPQPAPAATAPAKPAAAAPMTQTAAPKTATVDINNATAADLKALPGVSDSDAGKIVQGRPYKDPSDLTVKKILSDTEYTKIKDRLVAGPTRS
jgi:DNA uptake protein ComE-like DNA-binding protein